MPGVWPADYLLAYFGEIGMAGHSGMGAEPLSWAELGHWASLTGTPLSPWEALTLRGMSDAYVSALNEYSGKSLPPPWRYSDASPEKIAAAMDRAFDRFNKSLATRGRRGSRNNSLGR